MSERGTDFGHSLSLCVSSKMYFSLYQHQKAAKERSLCSLILRDGHQILMITFEVFRLHCNPWKYLKQMSHHLYLAGYTQE